MATSHSDTKMIWLSHRERIIVMVPGELCGSLKQMHVTGQLRKTNGHLTTV